MVTVNVQPADDGATLLWIGRDADPNLPGHQVPVTVGGTTSVSVLVDAEDGVAERWYRIEVARASNQEKGWRVYDDVLFKDIVDDPRLPSHYLRGLWADDSRVFVTANRHDPYDENLYAFSATDSSRRPGDEFVLGEHFGAGIWSDGTTLWAMNADGELRAFNLSDGSHNADRGFDVRPSEAGHDGRTRVYYRDNSAPRGIWSDGETVWVVDREDAKAYAYELDPGRDCSYWRRLCRQTDKEFIMSGGNDDPWGITATDDTWWVTDMYDRMIYAYDRSDGSRDNTKDIDLSQLGIINLQQYYYGLSINESETIMYVAEYITSRVYSFSMPGVSGPIGPALVSSDATLSSLSLTGVLPDVATSFDSRQTAYFGSVAHDVTSTTVAAAVNVPSASYEVKYGATEVVSGNGVVPLTDYGNHNIKVVVTAQDGTIKTYTVTVTRPRPSADATLSDLSLSGVNLGITPGSVADNYSATVDNSLTETTVMATPNDADVTSVVIKHNGNVVGEDTDEDISGDHVVGQHVVSLDPEDVGGNTITVEVTPQDGVMTKIYTVEVTRERAKSDVATLMNLALQYENSEDTVALDREFDGTDTQNTRYAATVGHGVSTVVVKYETKDQLATAQIREGGAETDGVVANERTLQDSDNGAVPLEVGDNVNTVTVEVTAEDGVTVITYVVTITRAEPSNVATLLSLSLDPGELSPTFSSGTGRYTAAVLHGDDSIDLTYTKSDGTAKVVTKVGGMVGSDNTVTGGEPPLHTSLPNTDDTVTVTVPMASVGPYTVTFEVTAQDQIKTGLYDVTVTRPEEPDSDEATLGRLKLERAGDSVEVELDSPLADDDIFYEAEVGNAVTSIKVFAEPTDPGAQSIELQVGGVTDNTATKATLKAGHTVSLSEGTTTILTLIVTAQDGNDKTYTIHVVRLDRPLPGIATLAELVLKDAAQAELTLAPEFTAGDEPGQSPYTASVDNGVNKVHVTATATDPLATVEVIDEVIDADSDRYVPLDVAGGDNTVRVVVTAQDGSELTYEITVARAAAPPSDDATLSSLTLDEAPLNFMSDKLSYDVDVANGVTSATVRAVANSEAASLAVTLGSASAASDTDVKLTAPLAVGANVIEVVVTPEDQQEVFPEDQRTTKTYTITVTRASSPSNPGNSNPGNSDPVKSDSVDSDSGDSDPGKSDSVDSDPGNSNTGGGFFNFGGRYSVPGGGSGTDTSGDESDSSDSESDAGSPYTDAGDGGNAQEEAINALYGLGVLTGTECEENRICPNDALTRWLAAVWLVRVLDGEEPPAITESRFADVNASPMWQESMWFAPHVERLAEMEVTIGCATDPLRYCPDDGLTRGQVASWLARAFDLSSASSAGFSDTVDNTHEADIDSVVAAGIMSGCSTNPNRFCPDTVVTRGELALYVDTARKLSSDS